MTRWVHEKLPKKSHVAFFGRKRGPKIATFAINHKTWSHFVNVDSFDLVPVQQGIMKFNLPYYSIQF